MIKTKILGLLVLLAGLLSILHLSSCGMTTTRPKYEMSLAESAFRAAEKAKAQTNAPIMFRRAEYYYDKARSAYKRKYFNKAKEYAQLSKQYAEKAEYQAIRKQTGQ